MPGTTGPADDGVRNANNSTPTPPITPLLNAKLADMNPEIAAKVREVVARKR
jgi:hypothetical protein